MKSKMKTPHEKLANEIIKKVSPIVNLTVTEIETVESWLSGVLDDLLCRSELLLLHSCEKDQRLDSAKTPSGQDPDFRCPEKT